MTDTMTETTTETMTSTMTSAMGDTMTGTMTSTVEHPATTPAGVITVGRLREVLSGLVDDTTLHLGVLDHQRFNSLLGSMPITAVRVLPGTGDATLILHLPTS